MTETELQTLLAAEVKGLTGYLDTADYSNAINDAKRETGWALPITDEFGIMWFKHRCKRHLFGYLATESAVKFQLPGLRLNQKFDHLMRMINRMDNEFENVKNNRPEKFTDADDYRLFGTMAPAGFEYDLAGNEK